MAGKKIRNAWLFCSSTDRKTREQEMIWRCPQKEKLTVGKCNTRKKKRKKKRDIYKKKDKRKGEREVRQAFILMLFHLFAYPVLTPHKTHQKNFFAHLITRKNLGKLSPNCKL